MSDATSDMPSGSSDTGEGCISDLGVCVKAGGCRTTKYGSARRPTESMSYISKGLLESSWDVALEEKGREEIVKDRLITLCRVRVLR